MKKLVLTLCLCACAHAGRAKDETAWLELRSDHFEVRSDLPEADARAVVQSLEESRAAMLAVMWPGQAEPPGKMQVVALASLSEVQEFAGDGINGFFGPDPFGRLTVVTGGADARGLRVVKHELAHALADHYLARQPRWLSEGLACYLETLHLDHGLHRAVVGELDQERLRSLQTTSSTYRGGVLNLGSEFAELPPREAYLFESASWVLVHYLINERRDALNAYAARLAHGEDPLKAFDAQFPDLDEAAIQLAVHDYTHAEGTFRMFTLPLGSKVYAVTSRPLPRNEALALVAGLYLPLPGNGGKRAEAISRALQADPLQPLALAAAGSVPAKDAQSSAETHPDDWRAFVLLYRRSGDAKALEKASALSPGNPSVLAELSRTRGKASRANEALALALQAVALEPNNFDRLDALSWALAGKRRCKEALATELRALEVVPDEIPPAMLAQFRLRSIDLQTRCGATPGHVELTEADADTEPVRKQCGRPPQVAARGTISADYLVRDDGTVGDVRMTGDASTATLRAFELFLKSCRYQPALKDGKPVNMRLRQDLSVHAK
jgi:tetratricopeptide (TPR) repeat protein